MEDWSVFSSKLFFLIKTIIKKARQRVCCSSHLIVIIINLKMVTTELLGLMDLTKAQSLCIHELLEVIMVGKNKDLVFAAF